MDTKKSTPIRIDFKKEWPGNNGTVYYFDIEFANGDKGQFSSKKKDQNKFTLGLETVYTREEKVNGNYTNIVINIPQNQPGWTGGNKGKSGSNESFALSYAKDIAVVYIEKGQNISPERVCSWADVFYKWLDTKKATDSLSVPPAGKQATPPPAPVIKNDISYTNGSDGLTF